MSFCPGPCRRLERAKSLVHDGTGGMIVLLRLHCQSGFTAGAPAVSVARVNGSEARLSHDTREIALGGRLGSHCLERAQSRAVRTRQQQTCLRFGRIGPSDPIAHRSAIESHTDSGGAVLASGASLLARCTRVPSEGPLDCSSSTGSRTERQRRRACSHCQQPSATGLDDQAAYRRPIPTLSGSVE